MENINRHEIIEKLTPLVENTAMRFGLIPVEIDFSKENHKWFLRIYLFSQDHEVTLEDCENVTRSLNDFIEELIPVKYYLEVSSPGLERKFKSPKEYLIFKGRNVSIKLHEPLEGEADNIFKAKLIDFDEKEGVKVLRIEQEDGLIIPLDKIKSTKLYLE